MRPANASMTLRRPSAVFRRIVVRSGAPGGVIAAHVRLGDSVRSFGLIGTIWRSARRDAGLCEPNSMLRDVSEGRSPRELPYGRPMNTRVIRFGGAGATLALAIALAACSPGASNVPVGSLAVPSVDVSAGASLATGAALAALDAIDGPIAANQTSGALTADEAKSLQDLASGVRTALQSGDTTAARTAADNLSTKAGELAAKLNTDAGKQLTAAIAALKAALPAG